jgi:hypothetical protein
MRALTVAVPVFQVFQLVTAGYILNKRKKADGLREPQRPKESEQVGTSRNKSEQIGTNRNKSEQVGTSRNKSERFRLSRKPAIGQLTYSGLGKLSEPESTASPQCRN